ncbi:MAG TPA: copper resistance protein CopC [Rhodopila sp.]|nr:copper resistance protein CopC [Rhodopila sp.]
MTRTLIATTAFAAWVGYSVAAYAHAHLVSSIPPADSISSPAPADVSIDYTEGVEPAFSSIEVQDASGARVDTGHVHTQPDNNRRLIVELKPLPPGIYKVIWHATAVDTHKTTGTFAFTVAH